MSTLKHLCPTFLRFGHLLWNSPTFTTWGNQAVQALRLLAVTPLILISFNTTEIAAWYLFGSLSFLGVIISSQIGLVFSRMIAFAMGGAEDLAPIKGKVPKREGRSPNWALVERAYATTGALNAILVLVIAVITGLLGWFGLENLLREYAGASVVWVAFGFMVISQSVVFIFQQYSIALRGMNYVALSNRWNVVFSLLSILLGTATLKMGGGILEVVLVMQGVIILAVPINRLVLIAVEECRFKEFKARKLDHQVLLWAWEPAWKGGVVQLTSTGVVSIASIFIVRNFPVETAAALLLTMRISQSLRAVADAPFISNAPRMSQLIAQYDLNSLRRIVIARINQSQAMFGMALVCLIVLAPSLLDHIGSNTSLLPFELLVFFSALSLIQNQIYLTTQISAIGNDVICVYRGFLSLVVSILVIVIAARVQCLMGLVLALFVPRILLLNFTPSVKASAVLELGFFKFLLRSNFFVFVVLLLLALILIFYKIHNN